MSLKCVKCAFFVLISTMYICTSCSTGQPNVNIAPTAEALFKQPSAIPSFILRLEPMPSSRLGSTSAVCTSISYATLWEAGDTEEGIIKNLPSKIRLSIDLEDIPMTKDAYLYHGPATIVKDANGDVMGSVGIADTCFKVSLHSGTHLATLRVSTTSERDYQYTWAFTS